MALRKQGERRRALSLFDEWPMPNFPSWMRLDELLHDAEGRQLIRVEEFTEGGEVVVRAEIPGIDPEKDVEITVDHGVLTISAERTQEEKEEERDFRRRELRYGSFVRRVPLPDGVDEDAITAQYESGVLEVRAPVPEQAPSPEVRRVPVSRG